MTEETTMVKYQPKAKLASRRTLSNLLESQKRELQRLMPKHVPADRMIKMAMLAVSREPDLLECTQESVISAIMQSAELGLDLGGSLGDAYPVKFKNTCVLIVGYRGLAKLARQSGLVKRIEADVVYENDRFEIKRGTESSLLHVPAMKNRGSAVGAWALAEMTDGGVQFEYLSKDEIEKVRKTSRASNSLMWDTFWEEGAKKTAFRRLAKWLPLSTQDSRHEPLIEAIESSDLAEFDPIGASEDAPEPPERSEKLAKAVEKRQQQAEAALREELAADSASQAAEPEIVDPGASESDAEPDEKAELQSRCEHLGVKFDGRWGVEKLREVIEEHEAKVAAALEREDERKKEREVPVGDKVPPGKAFTPNEVRTIFEQAVKSQLATGRATDSKDALNKFDAAMGEAFKVESPEDLEPEMRGFFLTWFKGWKAGD